MSVRALLQVIFDRTPTIGDRFEVAVVDTINRTALRAQRVQARLAPVDTGDLRRNTTIDEAAPGKYFAELSWNQHYAIYQEMGTRFFSANPFAQPSVDEVTPQFIRDLSSLGF